MATLRATNSSTALTARSAGGYAGWPSENTMNFLAKIGLCGLLAGASAGVLYADPPGGWLSPSGVNTGASRTVEPGAVRIDANLSLVDLQSRVRLLREQTRADARHIQHQQQVARK